MILSSMSRSALRCVLQCVAVCCSVLQCAVEYCSGPIPPNSDLVFYVSLGSWVCVAVCRSVFQRVTACCSVLQCVAMRCSVLRWSRPSKFQFCLLCLARLLRVCCSVLQFVAASCSFCSGPVPPNSDPAFYVELVSLGA